MTPDEYEDITYELNRELGQAEQREVARRVEHAQSTICPTHAVRSPCGPCSGDHAAGEHTPGSHKSTCARCAVPTIPQAQLDGPTRAAGDDTLTDPEETDHA